MSTEKDDLLAELTEARQALIRTTRDLADEQLGLAPTASSLSLGGLIKHVAATEAAWVRFVLDGPDAMRYDLPDGVTWDALMSGTATAMPQWLLDRIDQFTVHPVDTLVGILAAYSDVAARTEEVVRGLDDLDVAHPLPDAPWNPPGEVRSARRVLVHVIAETTQHAGHADIIRESIDGVTAT